MSQGPRQNLECVNLQKRFGGTIALADVSLKFQSSGCVAIIGPNGAGKTTLINSLTGYIRLDAGNWFIRHRRVTRLSPYRIARLGVARTFQEVRLIQQTTVLENVLLALPRQSRENPALVLLDLLRGSKEEASRMAAMDLLRFVGLEDQSPVSASDLSYGQQKLLGIACCLATGASILVLDEPVAGVDPAMSSRILELLGSLSSQQKLIVFIEHNIEAVRQIADRVIVMDSGSVIADGIPKDVLERADIIEAYLD